MVNVSKKYLPDMAIGMQHSKVSLYIGDGLEYLQNNQDTYDVIIADLSDPDGTKYPQYLFSFSRA